jgi:DNA-binding NtrC family response regulator
MAIGSHASNELVIDDPAVSRFHCEIRVDARGARIRDLDSSNGTIVDGVLLCDGYLRDGSTIEIGRSALRFELEQTQHARVLSEAPRFGALVGASVAMRSAFALLERAAATDITVLLEGESGTGKEAAAEAIHAASTRASAPFIVVDCSAIPRNLLESELFGHERGAFTGADARRIGAFEEAHRGTIFLDEIGELPIELQPKLLRALEQREVRRLGQNTHQRVDIRLIAATNRDLRAEVNAGRFRSDLYFRLAVVKVALPPLRTRPEDLPGLVAHLLDRLGATPAAKEALSAPEFLAILRHAPWPGNVRELRNYLERCLVFQQPMPLAEKTARPAPLTYEEAREQAVADFERRFAAELLLQHGGKVAQAAAAARMNRTYLYRILSRYNMKG